MKNIKLFFLFFSLSLCTFAQVKTTNLTLDAAMKSPSTAEGIYLRCATEKVNRLPDDFSKLTKLKSINISGDYTTNFDFADAIEKLSQLPALESLSLYGFGDKFQVIPASIYKLKNLNSLDLSDDSISIIPPELCMLTKLQVLTISYNKLSSIPQDFGKLVNLEELYIGDNNLNEEALQPIFKLTKLTNLTISDTKITNIPRQIANLTQLGTLDVYGDSISDIPAELINMKSLKEIVIADTKMSEKRMQEIIKLLPNVNVIDAVCFPAGSVVNMADGSSRAIETIRRGEKIKGYDFKLAKIKLFTVETLQIHHSKQYSIYNVNLKIVENTASTSPGAFTEVHFFNATGNHPVYVKNQGWKRVENLMPGDVLLYSDDNQTFCKEAYVDCISLSTQTVPKVYNLKSKKGNYFVNGVLVNQK